jgi:hypothetical protein
MDLEHLYDDIYAVPLSRIEFANEINDTGFMNPRHFFNGDGIES